MCKPPTGKGWECMASPHSFVAFRSPPGCLTACHLLPRHLLCVCFTLFFFLARPQGDPQSPASLPPQERDDHTRPPGKNQRSPSDMFSLPSLALVAQICLHTAVPPCASLQPCWREWRTCLLFPAARLESCACQGGSALSETGRGVCVSPLAKGMPGERRQA